MGLPLRADFDLCEPILIKVYEKTKTDHATFTVRMGLNTSFKQPKNSTQTILVRDNQFVRLGNDNVKIESPVE